MYATLPAAQAALLFVLCGGPAGTDNEAEARKVIQRGIRAHGGADKLGKLQALTFRLKGKCYSLSARGNDYTATWAVQAPAKLRQEVHISASGRKLKVVRVVNGAEGWVQMADTTRAMAREALAERREGLYASHVERLVGLTGAGFTLAPLGEAEVGGKAVVGVRVSQAGHRDVSLFFDRQTGLLLKSQRRAKDPTGGSKEFTQEALFGDYKEVGGVLHAHQVTILRDGKKYADATCSDFQPREKLDDSVFVKPVVVASK